MTNYLKYLGDVAREFSRIGPREFVTKFLRYNEIRIGTLVGTDQFGNRYFENPDVPAPRNRWVELVEGGNKYDPSQVPPEWHGWLHQMSNRKGEDMAVFKPRYQANHHENKTGTQDAYYPPGHVLNKKWKPPGQP